MNCQLLEWFLRENELNILTNVYSKASSRTVNVENKVSIKKGTIKWLFQSFPHRHQHHRPRDISPVFPHAPDNEDSAEYPWSCFTSPTSPISVTISFTTPSSSTGLPCHDNYGILYVWTGVLNLQIPSPKCCSPAPALSVSLKLLTRCRLSPGQPVAYSCTENRFGTWHRFSYSWADGGSTRGLGRERKEEGGDGVMIV